jgi:hypothetical protein
MLAVSSALQMSLRAQQRYARLAARGDDVINRRPASDEPPNWATFDAPVPDDQLRGIGLADPDPGERARAASQLLDELLGGVDGRARSAPAKAPAPRAPAKKSAPRAPAKKQPARPAAASSATAAKKQAANKQPAKRTAKKPTDKAINAPRHTAPSRFDTVEDD